MSQRDVVYFSLVYELKWGDGGGGCGVSANEYSCAHGAQINFGDLTPYLTYGLYQGYLHPKLTCLGREGNRTRVSAVGGEHFSKAIRTAK